MNNTDLKNELESKCNEIKALKEEIGKNKNLTEQPKSFKNEDPYATQYDSKVQLLQERLQQGSNLYIEREKKYETLFKDMELKLRRAIASRDQVLKLREAEANNQQQLIHQLQLALEKTENEKKNQVTSNNTTIKEITEELTDLKRKNVVRNEKLKNLFHIKSDILKDFVVVDSSDMLSNVDEVMSHVLMKYEDLLKESKKDCNECTINTSLFKDKLEQLKSRNSNLLSELELKNKELIFAKLNSEQLKDDSEKVVKSLKINLKEKEAYNKEEKEKFNLKINELSEECSELKIQLRSRLEEKQLIENTLKTLKDDYQILSGQLISKNNFVAQLENEKLSISKENEINVEELKTHKEQTALKNVQFEKELCLLDAKLQAMLHKESNFNDTIKIHIQENEELRSNNEELKQNVIEAGYVIQRFQLEYKQSEFIINEKNAKIQQLGEEIDKFKTKLNLNEEVVSTFKNDYMQKNEALLKRKDLENNALIQKCERLNTKLNEVGTIELSLKEKHEILEISLEEEKNKCTALEKLNLEMKENLKTTNFKNDILLEESNRIKNSVQVKNNEIYNLKKDRKVIAKKLKEKHEKVLQLESNQNTYNSSISKLKNVIIENKRQYQYLQENEGKLKNEYKQIQVEKQILEDQLLNREEAIDTEVGKLLDRLNGSKDDILFLKKMLKSHKDGDNKAIKTATTNQQTVTKQRAQIDSLKSKMTWLKDALTVSENARMVLENDINVQEKTTQQHRESINMLEEQNNQLNQQLELETRDVRILHQVLQKVAARFEDVYSVVLKQEHYLNERSGKQIVSNNIDHYSPRANTQTPIVLPSSIKLLMKDMKDVFSSTLENINNNPEFYPPALSPVSNREKLLKDNINSRTDGGASHLNEQPSTTTSLSNSQKLEDYIEKYDTEISSFSNILITEECRSLNINSVDKTNNSVENLSGGLQSVENLSVGDQVDYFISTMDNSTSTNFDVVKKLHNESSNPVNSVNQLQGKLNNLLQMGANLKSNNQELATLMSKHSNQINQAKALS